jgi:large subunit ribosomal protein L17
MRHLKSSRSLGVKPAHRRSMLRNLVTSVLEHEQIRTTVTRAKTLRKPLARMITLAKQGDLAARRQALAYLKSKAAMARLFGELAERYQDRQGGYCRILRLGPRRGDGAEMALVMLVGHPADPFAEAKQPRRRGGKSKSKPKEVIETVAEQVRAEDAPQAKGGASSKAEAAAKADSGAPAPEEQGEGEGRDEATDKN